MTGPLLAPEVIDNIAMYVNLKSPEWIGEAEVFVTYNYRKEHVEFCVYFTVHRSQWVSIATSDTNDGEIDKWLNLRADYDLPVEDYFDMTWEEINDKVWGSVYQYWSEILLCPSEGGSADPIYHASDRSIFLPRDEVRKMIQTHVDLYAPRIGQNSMFREEDWYKEWEASRLDSEPDT